MSPDQSSITNYMTEHRQTASDVVSQLRAEVEAKTKLTISAGIAPNRMLAKVGSSIDASHLSLGIDPDDLQICSDQNKPNGQFELEFERTAITRFMRDLPVR